MAQMIDSKVGMNGIAISAKDAAGVFELFLKEKSGSASEVMEEVSKLMKWVSDSQSEGKAKKEESESALNAMMKVLMLRLRHDVLQDMLDYASRISVMLKVRDMSDEKRVLLPFVILKYHGLGGYGTDQDFTKTLDWIVERVDVNEPIFNRKMDTGDNGKRLIHVAIEQGNRKFFDKLVEQKASLSGRAEGEGNDLKYNYPDFTTTYVAVKHKRYDMLEDIVASGESPFSFIQRGGNDGGDPTPLHPSAITVAVSEGDWKAFRIFLKHGYGVSWWMPDNEKYLSLDGMQVPMTVDRSRIWMCAFAHGLVEKAKSLKERRKEIEDSETAEPVVRKAGLFGRLIGRKDEIVAPVVPEKPTEEMDIRWDILIALGEKRHEDLGKALVRMHEGGFAVPTFFGGRSVAYLAGISALGNREWNPESNEMLSYGRNGVSGVRLACLRTVIDTAKSIGGEFGEGLLNGLAYADVAMEGCSLAHWAILMDEPSVLEEFLSVGVPVTSSRTSSVAEPGVLALRQGADKCLEKLIEAGLDPLYPDEERGVLGEAMRAGKGEQVRRMLSLAERSRAVEIAKENVGKQSVPEVASAIEEFALTATALDRLQRKDEPGL